eukprot:scaffold122722_cov22-Tisochrysis_lutea.AAC.1
MRSAVPLTPSVLVLLPGLRLGAHLGAHAASGCEEPNKRAAHRAQQLPLDPASRQRRLLLL